MNTGRCPDCPLPAVRLVWKDQGEPDPAFPPRPRCGTCGRAQPGEDVVEVLDRGGNQVTPPPLW